MSTLGLPQHFLWVWGDFYLAARRMSSLFCDLLLLYLSSPNIFFFLLLIIPTNKPGNTKDTFKLTILVLLSLKHCWCHSDMPVLWGAVTSLPHTGPKQPHVNPGGALSTQISKAKPTFQLMSFSNRYLTSDEVFQTQATALKSPGETRPGARWGTTQSRADPSTKLRGSSHS